MGVVTKNTLERYFWRRNIGRIIRHKYLNDMDFTVWMRRDLIGTTVKSAIWRSFNKITHNFMHNLCWAFGSGHQNLVG